MCFRWVRYLPTNCYYGQFFSVTRFSLLPPFLLLKKYIYNIVIRTVGGSSAPRLRSVCTNLPHTRRTRSAFTAVTKESWRKEDATAATRCNISQYSALNPKSHTFNCAAVAHSATKKNIPWPAIAQKIQTKTSTAADTTADFAKEEPATPSCLRARCPARCFPVAAHLPRSKSLRRYPWSPAERMTCLWPWRVSRRCSVVVGVRCLCHSFSGQLAGCFFLSDGSAGKLGAVAAERSHDADM